MARSPVAVQQQRCLWKTQEASTVIPMSEKANDNQESYDSIAQQFASRPVKRSFVRLCSNAVVVVQEFALTSFLLARHRCTAILQEEDDSRAETTFSMQRRRQQQQQQQQFYMDASTAVMYVALGLAVVYSARADQSQQQDRKTKVMQRTLDAALLAVLLRFSAAVLQSLTASYSSDTVEALALAGMLVHLLFCDYSYANGRRAHAGEYYYSCCQTTTTAAAAAVKYTRRNNNNSNSRRPPFQGGTVSLNAALFATTLLVSRLESGQSVYLFVSLSIVLFSFYPVTRHSISYSYPSFCSAANWLITAAISSSTLLLLLVVGLEEKGEDPHYQRFLLLYAFVAILLVLGVVLPAWKYFVFQNAKVLMKGPWDVPTAASLQLNYSFPP